MILKRVNIFVWTVVIVAWCFDFLFWEKAPGISIPMFIILVLAAGFWLARQQGLAPAPASRWLLVPIAFFGLMTVIRLEPMTTFLNLAASLGLMGLLAHSFLGGKWWLYSFRDYILGVFQVALDSLIRPIAVLANQPRTEPDPEAGSRPKLRRSLAVLRGLLLAIPVVLVFAGMLSEADPIFEQGLTDLFAFLKIENLGEYIIRGILISILAYLLLGVYLHALYKDHDENLASEENRWIPRFLGFTEAAIVLGSVNLLFLAFVAVQFRYFFGGPDNIQVNGFTYAEYARRGFGELVAVAVFSLLLFIGLSVLTKKAEENSQKLFSGLGILLVSLVSVILVSSFKRLLLYEEAYGFSRLRMYTHVFIIWLGVLLLAVILLEVFSRQRHFALAAAAAALGFALTLNIINVDGMIVQQNVNRTVRGESLDIAYLASLSEDALPALADLYNTDDGDLNPEIRAALACHAELNHQYDYQNHPYRSFPWQSFHLSRFRAQQIWTELSEAAPPEAFRVHYEGDSDYRTESYALVDGEKIYCYDNGWD